jgi:hypothetical protein
MQAGHVPSSSSPEGQTAQSAIFEDPEQQGEHKGLHSNVLHRKRQDCRRLMRRRYG